MGAREGIASDSVEFDGRLREYRMSNKEYRALKSFRTFRHSIFHVRCSTFSGNRVTVCSIALLFSMARSVARSLAAEPPARRGLDPADPQGAARNLDVSAVRLIVADRFRDEVEALSLTEPGGIERWRASGTPVEGGRGGSVRVELPKSGTPVHLRPLRHGGWLRALTGRRFLGIARSAAELEVTEKLRAAGASVPDPVLVLARHQRSSSIATGPTPWARPASLVWSKIRREQRP